MTKFLNDLWNCCSNLGSEKLTERKQGASKLELLLKDNEVIQLLDEKSFRKSRSREENLNWDYLVDQVKRYVDIEIRCTKGDPSSTACKKKHKEIAQLYHTVVVKAEKRGHVLKAAPIFSHILNIFFKVDKSSSFIESYTSILLKCLLVKRKHTSELGVTKWHEFLSFYFTVLLESKDKNKGSQIPHARTIQHLLMLSHTMPYIRIDEIVNFFDEIFKNSRQEKSHLFLELMLSALVSFCWATVTDARGQICQLGEQHFGLLVQLWKYQITTIKVQLIDFFHLEILAHFCTDTKLISDKAYPWMNEAWKNCLKEMLQLIYLEFLQLREKIRTASSKSLFQKKEMIEFVASVIHQIQLYSPEQLNISMSCSISSSIKKTKVTLESAWEFLNDGLQDVSEPNACITWLNVVICLFSENHLITNCSDQHVQLISVLANMLSDNHREDVKCCAVKTLYCILNYSCAKNNMLTKLHDTINTIWKSASKLLELSENKDDIYQLLHCCWNSGVVSNPAFHVFKMFASQECQRTYQSMRFLSCILQSCNFPNCPKQSMQSNEDNNEFSLEKHELRKQLLEWLLPIRNEISEPIICKKKVVDDEVEEMELLCSLLATLICVSPANAVQNMPDIEKPKKHACRTYKEMQKEYLINMHNTDIDIVSKTTNLKPPKADSTSNCKCLKEAEFFLSKKLEVITSHILNSSDKGLEVCTVEFFIFITMLKEKVQCYISSDTLVKTLHGYSEQLMKKFVVLLEGLIASEIDTSSKTKIIANCLKGLNGFVLLRSVIDITEYFPESLVELLTQITEGDFITSAGTTQHRTFDNMNSSSSSFDEFMELDCDQNDNELYKSSGKESCSPLDIDCLNEVEKVQLSAFNVVIMLMFSNVNKYEYQRRNLFSVFMGNGKHDNVKLQMLVSLYSTVIKENNFQLTSELLITVDYARQYLSAHRFDMDVCAAILTGMVCYINQLKMIDNGENEEVKMTVLKVVEVFWSLKNEKYSPFVRLKLADILDVLSQVKDPEDDWKLTVNDNDSLDTLVCASELFIQLLYDSSLLVRIHTALHLGGLFTDDSIVNHNKIFKLLCSAIDHLINNLDESHGSKDDVFFAKGITVLLVSKKIISSSTILESKGIWLLFEFAKLQIVKQEHVFMVLQDIAVIFGYDNVYDLMSPHILYIIFTFFIKGFTIDTFPSGCLGLTDAEFLKKYYQKIVPYYVVKNNFEGIEDLGTLLGYGYDTNRLLLDSFVLTLVLTLPVYSEYINGGALDDRKKIRMDGLKTFRECIGEEAYNRELEQRFDEIVLQLMLRIHDSHDKDLTMSPFTLPTDISPFYPNFTSGQVSVSLSHLAVAYGENTTTISSFLKYPERIPNILCNLGLHVNSAQCISGKMSTIRSYYFFSMFLLDNLHHLENYGGNYIIREILYRVLYFIEDNGKATNNKDYNTRIMDICFKILDTLCERISSHMYVSTEFSNHLCFVVSKLIHFTEKETMCLQALNLLHHLIADSTQNEDFLEYITAVSLLDDFPVQPKFTQLNDTLNEIKRDRPLKTLDEELKRITRNLQQLNFTVPNSVLEYLKKFLSETSLHMVSGESFKDIVACLLRICNQGDVTSSLLAVDCLGLIGPLPISALNGGGHNQSLELPPQLFLVCPLKFYVIVEAILQLCVHKCSAISKAAWNCLLRLIKWNNAKPIFLSYKDMPLFTYVQPFLQAKRKKVVQLDDSNASYERFSNTILYDKQMSLDNDNSHEKWLRSLVSVLLTSAVVADQIFLALEPLCQLHVDFARLSFPFVVHNVIVSNEDNKRIMDLAFKSWLSSFLSANEEKQKQCHMKQKMIEIIHLITSLRSIDKSTGGGTCWDNNFWLDINYLKLAQAAFQCGQYYNAAMFIEISSDPLTNLDTSTHNGPKIDQLFSSNFNCTSDESLSLLYNIYSNIGDVDAIYGIDTNTSMQTEKRLQIYQCEKEFHKALLTSNLSCSSLKCSSDVLETLMKSELYHTALLYLQSLSDEDVNKYSEIQFEAAWRNGLWDTTQLRHQLTYKTEFHGSIYQSFISLESQEEELFEKHIAHAKLRIIDSIQTESNSTKSLYGILSKCFTVGMLESAGKCALAGNVDGIKCPSALSNDFLYYEPSLSVVSQVIKTACCNSSQGEKIDILEKSMKHLMNYCKLARESQRYEVAEKFICMLSNLNGCADVSPEWKLEEAKVYWDRTETNHAMHLLRLLMSEVKTGEGSQHSYIYPVVLGLYGHWLGETKSEYPVHIMENYLEPAIHTMEDEATSNFHSPIDAYHSLAKYADVQYQSLQDYVKSPIFERKQAVIKMNKDELSKYSADSKKQEQAVQIHFKMLEKQCIEDESELEQTLSDQKTFLEKAIYNYCKCLQHGEKYNLKVLRLCSLWFEHYSEDRVNNKVKIGFPKIKSSKFLLVMHQLAARLGTNMTMQSNTFKEILEEVIKRCCLDHPHHSIFILLALCNADYEENLTAKVKKKQGKGSSTSGMGTGDKSRINAAKSVLASVKHSKAHLVQDAEKLSMAYIDLAYWDISHLKNEKGSFMIPDSRLIRKINHLSSIATPTIEIQVDPLCEYKDVVHITKFDASFTHAGGVNLPKIITCISSDGCSRKQLIKGRDDLRQDAVMQQVFGVVNLLLKSDPETRRRDLQMRTYKIVPLSRKSGLMEWCEGTIPLGNYLIGDRNGKIGAHTRYYPKDWSQKECRSRLHSATLADGKRSKYNVFQEIQKNFHPVFRHFFYEKFRDPADWFAKRLSYTRSTAVCSIIGYIVGLGDRHCQNILIDCNSADAIHIDLGVAFEKGKLLPTPETIPFRLTRDIIDGMGINGVNGVFRRCCEKTMCVMRNSQEAILTIVEVLLYDPLSDWTISSEKLRKIQKGRNSEENGDTGLTNGMGTPHCSIEIDTDRNKTAERVLIRLKQKLAGSEGGPFLGVQGHVNLLMQEACNQNNLSRLYPGWQPWV